MTSNMLGSSEFFKRSLDALKDSKPDKASALYRDMVTFYEETKENSPHLLKKMFNGYVLVQYFERHEFILLG